MPIHEDRISERERDETRQQTNEVSGQKRNENKTAAQKGERKTRNMISDTAATFPTPWKLN